MTPTDVLVDVIHKMRQADPDGCLHEDGYGGTGWVQCERDTYSLLDALDALGFTVARTQDAADGEALRAMDEAFPAGYTVGRWNVEGIGSGFHVHAEDWDSMPLGCGNSGTFSDACRAAIEATR